jgi:hypothetical protein
MVPDGQEKMKAHVGSLASQINVNQWKLMAKMNAQVENVEATDLEANPEEIRS